MEHEHTLWHMYCQTWGLECKIVLNKQLWYTNEKKKHVLLNLGFSMYAKKNLATFVQFKLKLVLQSI